MEKERMSHYITTALDALTRNKKLKKGHSTTDPSTLTITQGKHHQQNRVSTRNPILIGQYGDIFVSVFGHVYIVIITISWLIIFANNRKLRKLKAKNKNNYDLKQISFVIIPEEDDTVLLNINYGEKVLRSTRFTDADLLSDKNAPFKEFVKWCEEEGK